jgi:hypothetical protein
MAEHPFWEANSRFLSRSPPPTHSSRFMGPEYPLLCSQEPLTDPYPEPNKFSFNIPTPFTLHRFQPYILASIHVSVFQMVF